MEAGDFVDCGLVGRAVARAKTVESSGMPPFSTKNGTSKGYENAKDRPRCLLMERTNRHGKGAAIATPYSSFLEPIPN